MKNHILRGIPSDKRNSPDDVFQCFRCRCIFSTNGAKIANFLFDCDLEAELVRLYPQDAQPLLVEEEDV